ncbi:putative acyl-CoA dehydrogenase [Caenibius tardaugens NBRC 16725]|uniref:Putative acyl-CoA dehydrogenase n=1 Tax=Caenibius tardaugens NBRC 16725 TaxID=1219035 RepID=U2YC68_9SPHN|nr:acyl-CoA dehydrogenase family protein [Caenibius tardaugens]AZI35316.1 acyl-CoA dehydrogenase [Caenibius tardaugens NBRC 16725]GAD51161.1 putative acyl-CoA dehydrogenase [Caenibius tardaugens NBRC 16725]
MQSNALSTFRSEARTWLEANFTPSLAFKNPVPYQNDAAFAEADADWRLWRDRMAKQRWGAPGWPAIYGGAALEGGDVRILDEEMARIGAFNPMKMTGYTMLGPTLMEYGTDAQKARHLPGIATGQVRWCQGFSEPGAGSDLASLQTRCRDAGDHWVVDGQKVWTSGANHADWCFALVRTDAAAKQRGISFLLFDMRSPGVETRPITLISGSTHFCEMFLNAVKVPKDNIVGRVNEGWGIAKRLLQFERDSLSQGRGEGASLLPLAQARIGVDEAGRIAEPDVRARLIRHNMRAQAYNLTIARIGMEAKSGISTDSMIPVLKNLGSDIAQERADLMRELLGEQGVGWSSPGYSEEEIAATRHWLHSRAFSIYGGSYEIQNNIAAKRTLALPEPQQPR